MIAPTKRELNAKLVHYRQLAADRAKEIGRLSLMVSHSKSEIDKLRKMVELDSDLLKNSYQTIDALKEDLISLQADNFMLMAPVDPWQSQHGGKHYAELTIQPLQYTLGAMGYEAFKGACHNHVARYTTRKKDDEVEQLKKAKHILELWIYEAEKQAK